MDWFTKSESYPSSPPRQTKQVFQELSMDDRMIWEKVTHVLDQAFGHDISSQLLTFNNINRVQKVRVCECIRPWFASKIGQGRYNRQTEYGKSWAHLSEVNDTHIPQGRYITLKGLLCLSFFLPETETFLKLVKWNIINIHHKTLIHKQVTTTIDPEQTFHRLL